MRLPLVRPHSDTDRRLAAAAHASGLLGITVVGWVIAAAVSLAVLYAGARRRSGYLVTHAGQAALYQLAVFGIDVLALAWLAVGFIASAGEIPGLPLFRLDQFGETVFTVLQIVWAATVLLWPPWHLFSTALPARGALRVLRDREFWYPVAGARVRRFMAGPGRAAERVSESPPATPPEVPPESPREAPPERAPDV